MVHRTHLVTALAVSLASCGLAFTVPANAFPAPFVPHVPMAAVHGIPHAGPYGLAAYHVSPTAHPYGAHVTSHAFDMRSNHYSRYSHRYDGWYDRHDRYSHYDTHAWIRAVRDGVYYGSRMYDTTVEDPYAETTVTCSWEIRRTDDYDQNGRRIVVTRRVHVCD